MLIMIIIKIIYLFFIEIAHTDDFPSTGTRLVYIKYLTTVHQEVGKLAVVKLNSIILEVILDKIVSY